MTNLLVVHHTPSPSVREMLDKVLEGTNAEGLEEIEVTAVV